MQTRALLIQHTTLQTANHWFDHLWIVHVRILNLQIMVYELILFKRQRILSFLMFFQQKDQRESTNNTNKHKEVFEWKTKTKQKVMQKHFCI